MSRLLHLLLNYFVFAGTMFFVSGASVGDLGGGGGDAGAGGDSGDSGDSGASGDGGGDESDTGADGGGDGADDAITAGDGADTDPDKPVDLGDGRQVPAKWKNLFEAAKAQGLDKEVKQLFFGAQRLATKFPGGINEAIQLADKVQEFGGVEGIADLKEQNSNYSETDELFLNKPQEWIQNAFSAEPDAALKAFTHSLDYVAENHGEMYDHLMSKVVLNTLDEGPVHDIYGLLTSLKDNPQAQEAAKKLAAFYNNIKKLSAKVPEKKPDVEMSKLEQERQKLGTEKEQLRNHTVNSQTIPILGRQMTTHLENLAEASNFDLKKFATEQPGSFRSMRGEILKRVMAKASSDKTFTRNYRSVLNSGDTTRAVSMMNKKHNEILPEIVTTVAREWGVTKKQAGAAGNRRAAGGGNNNAAGNANAGIQKVSAKPDAGAIDWAKTGTRIYDSVAVLKNGKTVTWA